MKVIGVSGLPGSGKNLISKIAKKRSNYVFNMGDIVREEAKKRGEDSGKTAVNLRKEQGEFVLAKIIIDKIKVVSNSNTEKNINNNLFFIEGIRSQFEVDLFKKNFEKFLLISVFSSPKTRFERLKMRNRDDDSQDYDYFLKRDQRELNFGIGNVIATSDFIIINEGSLDEYKIQVKKIL